MELSLSFSDVWSVFLSTDAAYLNAAPIKEGLQHHGEGCDKRQVQVS